MLQASSVPGDAYAVIACFAKRLVPTSSGALYVHVCLAGPLGSRGQMGRIATEGSRFPFR